MYFFPCFNNFFRFLRTVFNKFWCNGLGLIMMSVKQENICRFQNFLKLSHDDLHITGFIMNKVLNNFLWLEVLCANCFSQSLYNCEVVCVDARNYYIFFYKNFLNECGWFLCLFCPHLSIYVSTTYFHLFFFWNVVIERQFQVNILPHTPNFFLTGNDQTEVWSAR